MIRPAFIGLFVELNLSLTAINKVTPLFRYTPPEPAISLIGENNENSYITTQLEITKGLNAPFESIALSRNMFYEQFPPGVLGHGDLRTVIGTQQSTGLSLCAVASTIMGHISLLSRDTGRTARALPFLSGINSGVEASN